MVYIKERDRFFRDQADSASLEDMSENLAPSKQQNTDEKQLRNMESVQTARS